MKKLLDKKNLTTQQLKEKTKLTLKIKNISINLDNNITIKDIKNIALEHKEISFKRLVY